MTPFRIAIAGLGTVGSAVLLLLKKEAECLVQKIGRPVEIVAVSARSRAKHICLGLEGIQWIEDVLDLTSLPSIDAVCECIGGTQGVAKALSEETLKHGKILITANKALLAEQGVKLAQIAEENNTTIFYEAAVTGGIPSIKVMREALIGSTVTSVRGILNGTSNAVLDSMDRKGLEFAEALTNAQENGYAELNPSADIDGFDAAHKLVLLSALAYGASPQLADVKLKGIRSVTKVDLNFARQFGYVIKLMASAEKIGEKLDQRVSPRLVRCDDRLAAIEGVTNAIELKSDPLGALFVVGAGAGGEATACAVIADIADAAMGVKRPAFGSLTTLEPVQAFQIVAPRYIRVEMVDKAGFMDEIQAVLGSELMLDHRTQLIGCERFVAVLTKPLDDNQTQVLTDALAQLDVVVKEPLSLCIETKAGEE